MAHQAQPKGFLGWAAIKKTAGQIATGPALDTIYSFPTAFCQPRNPTNLTYMPVVNVSGAPSVKVASKKTPSVALTVPLKATFCNMTFFNSLIGGSTSYLSTTNDSDEYAVGVNNGNATRIYDGSHCASYTIEQQAVGGPITLTMAWVSIYGDSEKGVPTVIAAPSVDAGSLHDVTKVDWNSTAEDVFGFRLTLMRPQGYQFVDDATLYAASVESGMIGGTLTIFQNPLASTVPTTSCTIKIGGSGGAAFALDLSLDDNPQDVGPTLGTRALSYTLFKAAGGYPVAITAIP